MKVNVLTTILFVGSISGISMKAMAGDQCSSSSFCVHGEMPLYSQADKGFLKAIGQPKDKGYCGAGASAMIFKTYFLNLANSISGSTSNDFASSDPAVVIKAAGQLVKTNFKKGGTLTSDSTKGFKNFLRFTTANHSGKSYPNYYNHSTPKRGDRISKAKYKKDKFIGQLWVGRNHFVVLNGYQDDKFVIYDPWKRIYNVKLTSGKYLTHPSGYGYVQYYSKSKKIEAYVMGALVNKIHKKSASNEVVVENNSSSSNQQQQIQSQQRNLASISSSSRSLSARAYRMLKLRRYQLR
ncbi:MAG: hypothetical protein VX642_06235 [Bdellovibrionota bacterium]|nr:hypothetical protein [Bdellovibrionota bacterium]